VWYAFLIVQPALARETRASLPPGIVLIVVGGVPIAAIAYHWLALRLIPSPMSLRDSVAFLSVLAVAVAGGYQLFFWVQRNNRHFPLRSLHSRLDDAIPFWPNWVWIYSVLQFVAMAAVVLQLRSINQGVGLAFGGLVLLVVHSAFAILFPSSVPRKYREYKVTSAATRYLQMVQSFDNGYSCFPSLHCALTAFVAAALWPVLGYWSVALVTAIAVSCLFVKQQNLADLLPGILLGWTIFRLVCF